MLGHPAPDELLRAASWTRLLDHFRAMQIYGGAIHPETPGGAQFVAHIPVGDDEPSALAWIKY